ncbi:MAG: thioesterase domain-containing protein [Cyanobacteria bacterium J06592_8]
MKAAVVVSEIETVFGQQIPVESVAAAKTLETLAHQINQNYWDTIGSRTLVPANSQGRKRPFFYVHAIGGRGGGFMLARYLDPERPVYGLQAVGLDGKTAPYTHIQDMVEHYIQEIQTIQPHGPYLLGGQCIGGNIALEMAQQFKQRGEQVLLVAMSDSPNPLITVEQKNQQWTRWKLCGKAHKREKFKKQGLTDNLIENIVKVSEANWQVIISHCPRIYCGRVVYFSAVENRQQQNGSRFDPMQPNGWNQFVAVGIEIIEVPGMHGTYHVEPHLFVK